MTAGTYPARASGHANGRVAAVTETGSLVAASATGSQLPSYAGGAAHRIWIIEAQKVVPDLLTALRRVEDHCLPLENARAQEAYGQPSALNHLLVINADPYPAAAPSCYSARPSDSNHAVTMNRRPACRRLIVTGAGAGTSHGLIERLDALASRPGHHLVYSAGWELGERERTAIAAVSEAAWQTATGTSGSGRAGRARHKPTRG